MLLRGWNFLIYNARGGKLPFADNSVPAIYTNGVPIDVVGGKFPGISSSEIIRVLAPGAKWIHDGVIRFVKPG